MKKASPDATKDDFSLSGNLDSPSGNPVKSILKALHALDVLALQDVHRKGIGLFDLARQLGL